MFPLGLVLMPGQLLPLHIFEYRYREMVRECIEGSKEFGVVLIARGAEVGGGDQRHDIATRATLVQAVALEDGRYGIMVIGAERVRVTDWLPDNPYPQAMVEPWPDRENDVSGSRWWDEAGSATPELVQLIGRVRRAVALALELGDRVGDPSQTLPTPPCALSYTVADLLPVGPVDRLALLAAEGPVARLNLVATLLDSLEPVLEFRLGDEPSSSDPPDSW